MSLGTLVQWIFPTIGLGMVLWNLFNYLKAQRAMSWPSVSGKVVQSSLKNSDGFYKPEILYEYSVNGKSYVADRWRFGVVHTSWGKAWSKQVVAEYPTGRSVTVFFNPESPAEAVLEPGKTDWSNALFAASWALISLLALFSPHAN